MNTILLDQTIELCELTFGRKLPTFPGNLESFENENIPLGLENDRKIPKSVEKPLNFMKHTGNMTRLMFFSEILDCSFSVP